MDLLHAGRTVKTFATAFYQINPGAAHPGLLPSQPSANHPVLIMLHTVKTADAYESAGTLFRKHAERLAKQRSGPRRGKPQILIVDQDGALYNGASLALNNK